ncbi:MAG: hypothetical protein HY906_26625 [Deltaproteobacteria bacterium]|nr:hypothetical protein [Deltaproteobacteria bacterium]
MSKPRDDSRDGAVEEVGDLTVEARPFGISGRTAAASAYGVELTTLEAAVPPETGPWTICEVVTRNSVFRVDGRFLCTEVVDRATGKPKPGHKFLGRRLVGGQRQLGSMLWLCHPIPLRGSAAVFEAPDRRSHYFVTSPVESVLMKVTSVTVADSESVAAWDEIARTPPDAASR